VGFAHQSGKQHPTQKTKKKKNLLSISQEFQKVLPFFLKFSVGFSMCIMSMNVVSTKARGAKQMSVFGPARVNKNQIWGFLAGKERFFSFWSEQ